MGRLAHSYFARRARAATGLLMLAAAAAMPAVLAHGIQDGDAAFVAATRGPEIAAFLYLGAKHMVTGYDHLLFIVGVIFYLYRMTQVALYVTMFSLGHSITLLAGVLGGIHANAYLVDAIIGLSVVYKAFDNLGGFRTLLHLEIHQPTAVLVFGLFHGFGLATKLQALNPAPEGLWQNMLAFNVGVELGQLLALSLILAAMIWWRGRPAFARHATWANALLMVAGFLLMQFQLAGYFLGDA